MAYKETTRSKHSSREIDTGPILGIIGGILGMIIGLIIIFAGRSLTWSTGYEEGTLIFGMITFILSLTALYSSLRWRYIKEGGQKGEFSIMIGILAPAAICFSTAGLLWLVPGPIMIISSGILGRRIYKRFKQSETDAQKISIGFRGAHALLVTIGAVLISVPILIGPLIGELGLLNIDVEGRESGTRPMDIVWSDGGPEERVEEHVLGVLLVHIVLLLSSISLVITGIMSRRNVAIGISIFTLVLMIFFFLSIPNVLFNVEVDIDQFSGEHFRSISAGMIVVIIGSALALGSFLYHGGSPASEKEDPS